MAQVLVIQEEDRALRVPLRAGVHVVGSAAESDVRIGHPTVSRRHARITVSDTEVEIEDLGSSNGTLLAGRRLRQPSRVDLPAEILFGSIPATLEQVADRDLEPGIALGAGPSDPSPPVEEPALTTVSAGSMRSFALDKLPGLLARLEAGADRMEMAQAVGEALASSLPCLSLQVLRISGERREDGLLFTTERRSRRHTAGTGAVSETRVASGDIEVTLSFRHASQASGYRSLVDSAARLIGLADRSRRRRVPEPLPVPDSPKPPTLDPAVRALYLNATRVAQGDIGVLISGESGTGKEILARYIHGASPRREQAFVALNCAALPSDLLESELFGIEQGVATGVDSRPGRFEQADGGTLFLDEIGDMAPPTQAKILRVLQEGEVYRLGGRDPRPARARVLAATNRDLPRLLAEGTFRSDLYHRIADWKVELPPLRRRPADIPNLAAWFLERAAARRGLAVAGISKAAVDALVDYRWPGNIRQLEREVARAVLFIEEGELLRADHLAPEIRTGGGEPAEGTLKEILRSAERRALLEALEASMGNMTAAARRLGIGRSTLYRRLKELDLAETRGEEVSG